MQKLFILSFISLMTMSGLSIAQISQYKHHLYQVELIIFSHINRQGLTSEKWPRIALIQWPHCFSLRDTKKEHYSLLPRDDFILSSEEKALVQHGNKILLHWAWQQPLLPAKKAKAIHITGGTTYHSFSDVTGPLIQGCTSVNNPIWQVNGTITLTAKHYINLKLNLLFTQPLSTLPSFHNNDNKINGFAYFRLKQNRRLRNHELNYIDHPLYGVLVKIVPVN